VGSVTFALVPTTETAAPTSVQLVERMSVVTWSMQGVGLVGHWMVCESAEIEAIATFGGAGLKFATSERFKVTGNW
jgi:hypothetical protein